jgi:hypothetical protein
MFDLFGPDPDDPDVLPPSWTGIHVGQHLVEAFVTLLKQQVRGPCASSPAPSRSRTWKRPTYWPLKYLARSPVGASRLTPWRRRLVAMLVGSQAAWRLCRHVA